MGLGSGVLGVERLGGQGAVSSAYVKAVLADNPLAYYRLNETGAWLSAATSSTNFGSEPPSNAFDGNGGTYWTTNGFITGWLRAQLTGAIASTGYSIRRRDDIPGRNPTAWTFEGSNDGSTWTTLDTQSGVTWPTTGETKSYTFSNSTAYLYYRLNITANNGDSSYLSVAELGITGLRPASSVTAYDASGFAHHAAFTTGANLPVLATSGASNDGDTAITGSASGSGIEAAYASWMSVSNFTAEAWIKTTATGMVTIADRCNSSLSYNGWQFRINSGVIEFLLTHSGSALGAQATTVVKVNDGNWHHVAGTFDGANLNIYIDGNLSASVANTNVVDQPADGLRFGFSRAGNTPFVGSLDEAAYYGTALSAARLKAHANAGLMPTLPSVTDIYASAVLADTPLAYFRMDEASGNQMIDASGNNRHGSYIGSPTLGVTGLLTSSSDKAVTFNGSSQYGVVGAAWSSGLMSNFTLEAIVKPGASNMSGQILDRDGYSNPQTFTFRLNAGKLDCWMYNSSGTFYEVNGATSLAAGVAYHVAAVFDGSTLKVYLNGVQDGSVAASGTLRATNTVTPIAVGAWTEGSAGGLFNGTIDEAAIYGSALSAARIRAHYGATMGAYSVEVMTDAPAAYWRLGEASGTTMADSSGNARSGTYTGTPTLAATGLVRGDADTAVTFNAYTKFGSAPDTGLQPTTALTAEAVVNPSSTSSTGYILSKANVNAAFGSSWSWMLVMESGGQLSAYCFNSSTQYLAKTTSVALQAGVTAHVALRFDGSTLKVYLNGDEAASVAGPSTINTATGRPIMVGSGNDGGTGSVNGTGFAGTIDEAAVYTTALSAARLKAHAALVMPAAPSTADTYGSAVMTDTPLAYWRLAETSGNFADASGNAHQLFDSSPTGGAVTRGATGLLGGSTDKAISNASGGRLLSPIATWMQVSNFTIEAVIKPTQATAQAVIAARENWNSANNPDYSWVLYQDSTGFIKGEVFINNTGTKVNIASSSGVITANSTYHVAMTWDGTTLKIYLNGTSVATGTGSGVASPGQTGLTIGQPYYNGSSFIGTIDEVAFYGSALSSTRIAVHSTAVSGGGGGGTTRVNGTLSETWNVLGRVSGSVSESWAVAARVAGSLSESWYTNATSRVTKTVAESWETFQRTSGSVAESWAVLQRASFAAGGQSYAILWRDGYTENQTWNLAQRISTSESESWTTSGRPFASLQESWNVAARVQVALGEAWETIARVLLAKAESWQTLFRATGSESESWDLELRLTTGLNETWDGIGRVVVTESSTWNAAQRNENEFYETWGTGARVNMQLGQAWDALIRLQDDPLSSTWSAGGRAQDEGLVASWNVNARRTLLLQVQSDTGGQLEVGLEQDWSVKVFVFSIYGERQEYRLRGLWRDDNTYETNWLLKGAWDAEEGIVRPFEDWVRATL